MWKRQRAYNLSWREIFFWKIEEKVHGFERRALVDSSSMFYITSDFDITLFVYFCSLPLRRCHPIFIKRKKTLRKKHEIRKKEALVRIDQRSVSVSRHTGTGSTGSGSLLLGHYVIRWTEFALLRACEAEREPCVSSQRAVKEGCAVHSSRTPLNASLYKPKKYSDSRYFTTFLIH